MANQTELRNKTIDFAHKNHAVYLEELIEFTKIQSISTLSKHNQDMISAANFSANKLTAIGMENVEVMESGGHPIVYGDHLKAGKDKPTVVIYGHYDVQPVDPIELWKSQPFEPEVRGDFLYGRGASDMKGQVMASIYAIDALLQAGELDLNIKWLIEGEEEIGSPNLASFIKKYQDKFACDFALNPDGGMLGADIPSIPYSLRGLLAIEINVTGPTIDLHSGMFGGAVLNPANELARLVGNMHDENGRITIPGFYDDVAEMDEAERKELAKLPMDEDFYIKNSGAKVLTGGEKGYTPVERVGGRPTLDVNGFTSGYSGEGVKTILPSKAQVKITSRLVPNQDPIKIFAGFEKYFAENANPGINWTLTLQDKANSAHSPRESEQVQAMAKALETVWGKKALYYRVGGSVPVVAEMQEILKTFSVITGFGLPDDNIHSPNEKLSLPTWYKGIDALIHFFYNLV
jgi:acetylornithine deacetylase/succinyl-diaminopimelate desuccinylase-like protein